LIRFRDNAENELTELVVASAQLKVNDRHWEKHWRPV